MELRSERVDVDLARFVRTGPDPLDLDPGFGQPRSEVSDEVNDRPVRVAEVARSGDGVGIERAHELNDLVPASLLRGDLGVEGMTGRGGRVGRRRTGGLRGVLGDVCPSDRKEHLAWFRSANIVSDARVEDKDRS